MFTGFRTVQRRQVPFSPVQVHRFTPVQCTTVHSVLVDMLPPDVRKSLSPVRETLLQGLARRMAVLFLVGRINRISDHDVDLGVLVEVVT
jgi:hypothetical protein